MSKLSPVCTALVFAGLSITCRPAAAGTEDSSEPALAERGQLDATVAEIQRGGRAAVEAVEAREIWLDEAASSTSHKLLACGRDCARSQGTGSLWQHWKLSMSWDALRELHRGEFLALAADLDVPRTDSLLLSDGELLSIDELLTQTLDDAADPSVGHWNAMEAEHDHELGWVRSAACRYLSTTELEGSAWREVLRADALPSSLATEAGTHELEGIAICEALHGHEDSALRWALNQRLANDLAAMAPDGQLYRHDESFTSCPAGDTACELFSELNRQAHFFEWVSELPELRVDAELERALARWAALVDEAEGLLASGAPLTLHGRMLAASASSHTVHAADRLARR
ncbi:hypothetical protein ENSA5_52990 [Enhygromyxa salina]|uniref:Uncharacterized protein n=1 Tax=Enhygromyxa salina TaxID=215803 RepID=A0A2S9XFS8_9BACT|nr:hypothetical protein [Enhygromyxa salina]PRP91719.1 hypothetical protein ENSA5_52990 [Enhygromyxa salina]